jgi:voltage-gated potassium channel Kch
MSSPEDQTHKTNPLNARLKYAFDNFMARGTLALVSGLAMLSLVIILLAGAIISLGGLVLAPSGSTQGLSFGEAAWESLMRTLDAGTMGGDEGWGFRFAMLVVTTGGVLIVSTLIGVLTAGVESKLAELRKGRSRVLENSHTLILGWSSQVFTILSELEEANRNQVKARIVILADRDKVEMEEEIRARISLAGSTRIICRSGSPHDLNDIQIGSPHTARSIIILPPEDGDPDAFIIKTILAITNHPDRHADPYHIVTQVHDPDNLEVIGLISQRDHIQPVLVGDLIARLTAQTSRQSGLSVVYTELLNFSGDEIYFQEASNLAGKTFAQALLAFEDSTLMGLVKPDGRTWLNPPMDTVIQPGDQIFALSADDDTLQPSNLVSHPVDESILLPINLSSNSQRERALILGWNRSASTILRELDHYVPSGSHIDVVTSLAVQAEFKECCKALKNQKATLRQADPTQRRLLDDLNIAEYDHVIVLSEAGLDIQAADARTLVTLLHLRDLAGKDATPFSIVSEMRDIRNRQLAEVTQVDDFIISEHLVSLMMSQLSENWRLHAVFSDIFDPEGSEIYLKPVQNYIKTGTPVNFYTLVEAACRRGETAIGYRLAHQANDASSTYGVHTNPKKSEFVTYTDQDKLIVLAEN